MSASFERLFQLSKALLATIDLEGRFIDLNPAWESTLGWTLAELRAMGSIELVHPDDLAASQAEGQRVTENGGEYHMENRYRCKDGSYRWLRWSLFFDLDTPVESRLYHVTAVDITPYKEALAELRLFESMLENVPDQVGIIDLHGKVRYRNPAAERHAGRKTEPGESITAAQVHSPEFTARLEREVTPVLQRLGVWSGEGDLLRLDGTLMPTYQILVTLRDEGGAPVAFGTLIRDMTEVKRMESQLRSAVAALATPMIPISDRVVVMPLIGQVDGERASQLMRVALEGVFGRGVEVVILDVTGLRDIDAEVGGSLLATARALGLLGVRTVLSGVQPALARALIGLGLDLAGVEVANTLQRAVDLALVGSTRAPRT